MIPYVESDSFPPNDRFLVVLGLLVPDCQPFLLAVSWWMDEGR